MVIRQLWADDKSENVDIIARANWVVDNVIPDVELALRFAPDGKERMEEIALIRLVSALSPAAITAERKASYADWLYIPEWPAVALTPRYPRFLQSFFSKEV